MDWIYAMNFNIVLEGGLTIHPHVKPNNHTNSMSSNIISPRVCLKITSHMEGLLKL